VRPRAGIGGRLAQADVERLPGAALRFGDPTDGTWLRRQTGGLGQARSSRRQKARRRPRIEPSDLAANGARGLL